MSTQNEERGPTWDQIVFKAHPNLALCVCGDREVHLSVDVFFGEVDIALGYGVDDVSVDVLAGARTDVGHDDDKGVADMKHLPSCSLQCQNTMNM